MSKIAPALIIGNSVVLKPGTNGSISSLYMAKIIEAAGVPNGVFNVITGRGRDIGDYIVGHEGIDFINFTGSTDVGLHISSLVKMKPMMMELGGKDPAIVLEDADLNLAAGNIVSGALSYSGQRCTAIKRVLVMDSVADELVDLIKEKMSRVKVGNPITEPNSIVVPLINHKNADFVMSLIEDAIKKGATLISGGSRDKNLINPTLLDNVTKDMDIAWIEPFGPVIPIMRFTTEQDMIDTTNSSEYGLQASIFTQNIDNAFRIADKLEVGVVQINNKSERGPDHFPFLGVKSSGIGVQGIKYSIEAMSRPKAIVINLKS
jgi:glyceraldehyde-3-phosphate dehydrogenase (NADP+)